MSNKRSIAMQVMSQIPESANVEKYMRDLQCPNTPEASSSPRKSAIENSLCGSKDCSEDKAMGDIQSRMVSPRPQRLSKRGNVDGMNGLQTPQRSSKRLRSSKTMRYINVGEVQTPSSTGNI